MVFTTLIMTIALSRALIVQDRPLQLRLAQQEKIGRKAASHTRNSSVVYARPSIAIPSTATPDSFPSCSHWSFADATAFSARANFIRMRSGDHLAHDIPRQILLNYGVWSGFTLPSPAVPGPEGADLSAFPSLISVLPHSARTSVECWLQTHPPPEWRIRLWDGPSSAAFMHRYHPHVIDGGLWTNLTRPVQRADLLRLLLLAHFGGIYIDLDVRPGRGGGATPDIDPNTVPDPALLDTLRRGNRGPRPLDELWADLPAAQVVLFEEGLLTWQQAQTAAVSHPIRAGRPEECQRIANYMMASAPVPLSPFVAGVGHRDADSQAVYFWSSVIRLLISRVSLRVVTDYDVLFTTGPAMLTEAVYAYAAEEALPRVALEELPPQAGIPIGCGPSASELFLAAHKNLSVRRSVVIVQRPSDQQYFDHMTAGTWRSGV